MNALQLIVLLSFIACMVIFPVFRAWLRQRRGRSIQAQRDAHLQMVVNGIERLAEEDPSAVAKQGKRSQPTGGTAFSEGMEGIDDIREFWGDPPEQEQVLEEILSGDEVAEGWDFAVHIHEGAEQYLGSEAFLGLEGRFEAVPGVEACRHEDREVFLVKTERLDAESILQAFWKAFLEAAQGASEEDKGGGPSRKD